MKITIKRIYRKERDTQNGKKWTMSVLGQDDVWYGAGFTDSFNKDWKEGQTIDVEVKDRIYEGKTYYDIVKPKNNNGKEILEKLGQLELKIDLLLTTFKNNSKQPPQLSTNKTQEEPPDEAVADDLSEDSLPF